MQRKLRYVLISTIVAIVGILIFQVYWITTTYDGQSTAFELEVNSALEDVLNEELRDITLNRYFSKPSLLKDTLLKGNVEINVSDHPEVQYEAPIEGSGHKIERGWIASNDSILIWGEEAYQSWSYEFNGEARDIVIDANEADELFNIVVSSLIVHEPDLQDIQTRYTAELKKRNIETPFFLAYLQDNQLFDLTGEDPGISRIPRLSGKFRAGILARDRLWPTFHKPGLT